MFDSSVGPVVVCVLLIRVGQIFLLSGTVRSKNAADAGIRGVIDLSVLVLAAWAVAGVWLPIPVVGGRPWLAWGNAFGGGAWLPATSAVLPAATLCAGTVLGATAERTRLMPNLILSVLIAAVLVPVVVRMGQGVDAAASVGGIVSTVGGGAAAWAMAFVVGPRKGKFNRDLSVNYVPGHGVPFQVSGVVLLAAGFGGLSAFPMNALLGLSAATLGGMAFARLKFGKTDVGLLLAAAVGGLAAAAVPVVPTEPSRLGGVAAVVAGGLAGVAVPWAVILAEVRFRVDDVTGTAASFFVGGTIGLVVAVAARAFSGHFLTFAWTSLAVWLMSVVVFGGVAFAVAKLFAIREKLRVGEAVEYDGLDLSQLDVNAYPDFQQTMIKSHHLRQL